MIGGLNSLIFIPQAAQQPQGKASSTDGEATFDDVLGQAQSDELVSEGTIPVQPGTPSLDGPAFPDRAINMAPITPFVKSADPTNKTVADEAVNSLTKRVVWNDFLRKMKNELGVSAEDVLNAFASLSDEDLARPPEQTIDKVVMALGLDGQQAQIAKNYFSELIQKTKPNSMGEELARSERDISLTLMSQREMDRKNMERSVDRMQAQFFMKGAYQRPTEEAAAQQLAPKLTANPMSPVSGGANATPSSLRLDVEGLQPVTTEKPDVDVEALAKKFMVDSAPAKMNPKLADVAEVAGSQSASAPVVTAPAAQGAEAQAALEQIFAAATAAPEMSGESFEEGEFTSDAAFLAAPLAADQMATRATAPSEFQNQLASVNSPQPMAVPDLVQQARVMVHDGGGEMKVTLTPDGLGEVAMRVSVNDGKVNVQMITESDEAKRLIERQLGELKTSLVSQHLTVDTIKVDTATNLGKQLEQQYHEAQRQMAQQTLEQFRQDHQGWRRSFFEVPTARVYKDQSDAPRDVRAPSASSRRAGNRRLDLVA